MPQNKHLIPEPGRKPGARVTNSARLFTPGEKDSIADSKSGCHRRVGGHLTDLKNTANNRSVKFLIGVEVKCLT